jgi:predicted nuclease with TOPRIM domain
MWDWAIWGALIVGFLAVAGAIAFVAVRVLQAWRGFKRARRHLVRGLEELGEKGEATTEKLETAADTEEVAESLARLRVSLAQLAVLREAIDEVQDTAGRITAVMPRK